MVRLVPDTHDFQFQPEVMHVFWQNRGHARLSTLLGNLAASLTNNIRTSADGSTSFPGKEGAPTTIYQIRWPWIVPPVVSVLLAGASLATARHESRRSSTPLWKGSTLAVLFHGLSLGLKRSTRHQNLQSKMNEEAQCINAKLTEADGGICLGKSLAPPVPLFHFRSWKQDLGLCG